MKPSFKSQISTTKDRLELVVVRKMMTNTQHYRSKKAAVEPELEVHSGQSPNVVLREESSTLQTMLQRQAFTMGELQKLHSNDHQIMTPERPKAAKEQSKKGEAESLTDTASSSNWQAAFELGSSHVWSEDSGDDADPALSMPATPTTATTSPADSVRDSIEAIREEASRVDAAIALDQLGTMKDELESLKKELVSRKDEIRDLHGVIHDKDSKLSTLELERALYKADAGAECEESSMNADAAAAQFILPSPSSLTQTTNPEADAAKPTANSATVALLPPPPPPPTHAKPDPEEQLRQARGPVIIPPIDDDEDDPVVSRTPLIVPPDRSPFRPLSRQSTAAALTGQTVPVQQPRVFNPTSSRRPTPMPLSGSSPFQKVASASRFVSLHQTPPQDRVPPPVETPDSFEYLPRRATPRQLNYGDSHLKPPSRAENLRVHDVARPLREDSVTMDNSTNSRSSRKARIRSKKAAPHSPVDLEVGTKTCLAVPNPRSFLLPRRKRNNTTINTNNKGTPPPAQSPYQEQAQEVMHLLRASLETSEELRKRLATVSNYYQNVVEELSQSLQESDAQRRRTEADLLQQIEVLKREAGKKSDSPRKKKDSPRKKEIREARKNRLLHSYTNSSK